MGSYLLPLKSKKERNIMRHDNHLLLALGLFMGYALMLIALANFAQTHALH